jgi:hypothetical protein
LISFECVGQTHSEGKFMDDQLAIRVVYDLLLEISWVGGFNLRVLAHQVLW